MLGNGTQRTAGVEDFQEDCRASTEKGAHQRLRLPAYVRRRQIDQSAGAAVSAKERAAHAHVLHRDVAVRKQGRLGRTGRAGGKDDQRAMVVGQVAGDPGQGSRVCIRHSTQRRLGNRRVGLGASNRLFRVHRDGILDPWTMRLHGAPQFPKIERRFQTQTDKPARAEDLQRSDHLGGGQSQIQRSDDHTDFETAIFQQNVVHGQRQQGDQEIALGEA